jgi:putative ABC transport system substrate-binding protein
MVKEGFGGFAVVSAPVVMRHRRRIAEPAARHRLPGVHGREEYVEAGGLMSYAAYRPALYRRVADQVHRILNGARPSEMPVVQPVKFDLVVSLKAAREIGVEIPQSVLLRADRVIE